jgi:5-methylcytosine-specific restriction endonuclease McrA
LLRPYDSKRWRDLRKLILHRDGYACQYCGKKADRVHHKIAWRKDPTGESWFDPNNLASCCNGCNARLSYADGGRSEEHAVTNREPNVWDTELGRAVYRPCPGHGENCSGYHSQAW